MRPRPKVLSDIEDNLQARTHAFKPRRSAVGHAGSKPTREEQHDEDDNDDPDDADTAMAEAVTVSADAPTEAPEQEHDKDYDEYRVRWT